MRRTLTICALLVLGTLVSGAQARDPGNYTKEVLITFPDVDSNDVLQANGAATSQINDSLFFASPSFGYDGPWTNITAHFVVVTKDTATATGLCRDSVLIKLQTREDEDSVKWWRTIGTTTKWPLKSWDSTGTAAALETQMGPDNDGYGFITEDSLTLAGFGGPYRGIPSAAINVSDADSVAAMGNIFRFLVLYSAEEDSLKSHITLNGTSELISILSELRAIVTFHLR